MFLNGNSFVERSWPLVTREFQYCDEFYGAHAPSSIKCKIPPSAKSFSVIGINEASRHSKFLVFVDAKEVYDSGITGMSVIKVDIPPKSSILELLADPAQGNGLDHTYWCHPRFHSVPADKVTDKQLDSKGGAMKLNPATATLDGNPLIPNRLIDGLATPPVSFRNAKACGEFLFAHAPSSVTYPVPKGMNRFTAVGYNALSHSVRFQVWADARQIFESPDAGVVPIDVKLPVGTRVLELKVDKLDGDGWDQSIWCYPRLYKK
jgi:hypothetical protein